MTSSPKGARAMPRKISDSVIRTLRWGSITLRPFGERGKLDFQNLINVGATAVLGVVGWFVKGIRDDMREHSNRLNEFQLDVARNYVTHQDLADIKTLLVRIEEKLDRKVDK